MALWAKRPCTAQKPHFSPSQLWERCNKFHGFFGWKRVGIFFIDLWLLTLPKFNSSPLTSYLPNRKVVFQPPFSGAMLNFGGVTFWTQMSWRWMERCFSFFDWVIILRFVKFQGRIQTIENVPSRERSHIPLLIKAFLSRWFFFSWSGICDLCLEDDILYIYIFICLPWNEHSPWKWMVGRLVSFGMAYLQRLC